MVHAVVADGIAEAELRGCIGGNKRNDAMVGDGQGPEQDGAQSSKCKAHADKRANK